MKQLYLEDLNIGDKWISREEKISTEEIKESKSKPDQGMVVVEIKTLNQNDEPVQLFTCTMLAFKRSSGILPLDNERLLRSKG